MSKQILVLGATGTLGSPVTLRLVESGHAVRVLARSAEKTRRLFGTTANVVEGDSTDRNQLQYAMDGCNAVHISLPTDAELIAVQHVIALAEAGKVDRISYVSGTSVREENRWFDMIDVKARAEELLRRSGIPHIIFCIRSKTRVPNGFFCPSSVFFHMRTLGGRWI